LNTLEGGQRRESDLVHLVELARRKSFEYFRISGIENLHLDVDGGPFFHLFGQDSPEGEPVPLCNQLSCRFHDVWSIKESAGLVHFIIVMLHHDLLKERSLERVAGPEQDAELVPASAGMHLVEGAARRGVVAFFASRAIPGRTVECEIGFGCAQLKPGRSDAGDSIRHPEEGVEDGSVQFAEVVLAGNDERLSVGEADRIVLIDGERASFIDAIRIAEPFYTAVILPDNLPGRADLDDALVAGIGDDHILRRGDQVGIGRKLQADCSTVSAAGASELPED